MLAHPRKGKVHGRPLLGLVPVHNPQHGGGVAAPVPQGDRRVEGSGAGHIPREICLGIRVNRDEVFNGPSADEAIADAGDAQGNVIRSGRIEHVLRPGLLLDCPSPKFQRTRTSFKGGPSGIQSRFPHSFLNVHSKAAAFSAGSSAQSDGCHRLSAPCPRCSRQGSCFRHRLCGAALQSGFILSERSSPSWRNCVAALRSPQHPWHRGFGPPYPGLPAGPLRPAAILPPARPFPARNARSPLR